MPVVPENNPEHFLPVNPSDLQKVAEILAPNKGRDVISQRIVIMCAIAGAGGTMEGFPEAGNWTEVVGNGFRCFKEGGEIRVEII